MAIKVSINGFSISALKQMAGYEGYVTSCNLLFNGKKIAGYYDAGDGGEYDLWPERGYSRCKIEEAVASFKPMDKDYGLGEGPIEWNVGILVEEIINRKADAKYFDKLWTSKHMFLAVVHCWKMNKHWYMEFPMNYKDDMVAEAVKKAMEKHGITDYTYEFYWCADQFETKADFVCEESMKMGVADGIQQRGAKTV